MTREEKLEALAEMLQKQQIEYCIQKYGTALYSDCKTRIIHGKKYTKIDVGNSGKLMVDAAGNIFGIKAYGVIHRGHSYGTLDTIDEWYWGEYYPKRKEIKS